jgi:hypothetical protein
MFGGSDIFVLIVVFLAILTVFLGVKTVPQGYNWTVERFGRYTRMLKPGLNLVVPFIDRIGRKMNVMEQVKSVDPKNFINKSSDLRRRQGFCWTKCWTFCWTLAAQKILPFASTGCTAPRNNCRQDAR